MRYLIYLILISFFISCGKKKENTTKADEGEKTSTLQNSSPELELEVVNPNASSPELKYEISGDKVIIISYTGTAENFIISDEIEGCLLYTSPSPRDRG